MNIKSIIEQAFDNHNIPFNREAFADAYPDNITLFRATKPARKPAGSNASRAELFAYLLAQNAA